MKNKFGRAFPGMPDNIFWRVENVKTTGEDSEASRLAIETSRDKIIADWIASGEHSFDEIRRFSDELNWLMQPLSLYRQMVADETRVEAAPVKLGAAKGKPKRGQKLKPGQKSWRSVRAPEEKGKSSEMLEEVGSLKRDEVLAIMRFSKTTLYQRIKDGHFPASHLLGPGRAVGWYRWEIRRAALGPVEGVAQED
jgi:predicted DNA-binding transcriptional regulator AlpA